MPSPINAQLKAWRLGDGNPSLLGAKIHDAFSTRPPYPEHDACERVRACTSVCEREEPTLVYSRDSTGDPLTHTRSHCGILAAATWTCFHLSRDDERRKKRRRYRGWEDAVCTHAFSPTLLLRGTFFPEPTLKTFTGTTTAGTERRCCSLGFLASRLPPRGFFIHFFLFFLTSGITT